MRTLGVVSSALDPDQTPAGWAFEDKFNNGATLTNNWTVSRQSSGSATDIPMIVGYVDGWIPSGGADGVVLPDDVVIYNNQLWMATGVQFYGDTVARCAIPFDFPDQEGTIEFDCWVPLHYPLFGWPHIIVTEKPYTAPSSRTDNSVGPTPERGFDIRLNSGQQYLAPVLYPRPRVFVYDDYNETELGLALGETGGGAINTVPHTMTSIRIEFTATTIDIYANDVHWYQDLWTLPTGFVRGWVYLANHNHASVKYGDEIPPGPSAPTEISHTYTIYDNFRFSGTRLPRQPTTKAADNIVLGVDVGAPDTIHGYTIGYGLPAGPLTVPGVAASPSQAWLLCSLNAEWSGRTAASRMVYSLNGNTSHSIPFDDYTGTSPGISGDSAGMSIFSVEVNVAELVPGNNTVTFSVTGYTGASLLFVANVQIMTKA